MCIGDAKEDWSNESHVRGNIVCVKDANVLPQGKEGHI